MGTYVYLKGNDSMKASKRTWAEISLDAIENNYNQIKNKVNNAVVCCVIKADGYGHGAVELAKHYETLGAGFLAVSNIDEARELRENNITLPILILGYTDPALAKELSSLDIHQTVYSYEYATLLNEQCVCDNVNVKIHIKLDTGMSRIGFMCQQFPRDNNSVEEIYSACTLGNLDAQGIFTHFCVSDEGDSGEVFTQQQYSAFTHTVDELKNQGLSFNYVHCSNSGAIEDYPHTYGNMVRAGVILYGLAPSKDIRNNLNLIPAMSLKTVVSNIKTIEKGATVSYGRTFTAQRKTKVATVPIGYADGYLRSYGKDGYMLIKGKKAKILGRICMDQTVLDVSDIDDISIGDEVIVFGGGEFGEQTATDLANSANTINYEVVCAISKRVPRFYIKDGNITEVMYKL